MKMKTGEVNELLLRTVRAALHPSEQLSLSPSEWETVRDELREQTVLALAADAVLRSGIGEAEKEKLIGLSAANIRQFHRTMRAEAKLLALLRANQIPAVILKGSAAAQYYPKPQLRHMGDIDLLVAPEDHEKAFRLLCASGYRNLQELGGSDRRHIAFSDDDGTEIELHRFFFAEDRSEQREPFDAWLHESMKNIETVDVCGYSVPVFPPLQNGLILLEHIRHHLSSGLGLRQIVDWYCFVQQVCDDGFWENCFREKAEALGLDQLAVVMTGMCRKYLGLTERITWCGDAEAELVDALADYVLKRGNFGRKLTGKARKTVSTARRFSTPAEAFAYLTAAGSVHMKAAGLRPVKAVAWLYQIGHLIRMTAGRRERFDLMDAVQTGIRESAFFKRLGVSFDPNTDGTQRSQNEKNAAVKRQKTEEQHEQKV